MWDGGKAGNTHLHESWQLARRHQGLVVLHPGKPEHQRELRQRRRETVAGGVDRAAD